MRITICIVLLSTSLTCAAESLPLPGVPPIDSAEEALHVANTKYFVFSSCYSFEFHTKVDEHANYWLVTQRDMRAADQNPCGTKVVAVCKVSGKLSFEDPEEECAT